MKKKLKTIQSSLFFTYSFLIILVLLVFVSFFYLWTSNVLKQKSIESISNLTFSFQEKLDNEIHKMDGVSTNILYSNLVKKNFVKYLENASITDVLTARSRISDTKELTDLLIAINGPSMPVEQIYLYDFKGNVFGAGFDNRARKINIREKFWYGNVLKNRNSKVVTLPHKDPELTKFVSVNNDIYYISLCRLYFDNYSTPRGFVEVKQAYNHVLSTVIDFMNENQRPEQVYVYDSSGNLIYPLRKMSNSDKYYFKNCTLRSEGNSYVTVKNPATHSNELLSYRYSEYTGWIVAVAIPEKSLLAPVLTFTKMMVMFAGVILIFALILSFIAARKYTRPIKKLRKGMRTIDLQDDSYMLVEDLGSGITELEELNQAFNKMNLKVKSSVEHMLLSQQHENQSRMLALQSQMNPHFLYNTLSTLNVMAEEGMDEEISEMCINVSDMLRYISSDKSPLVKINTEIDYTRKYLSCIKIRYGSKLNYEINIDAAIMDIEVPKLIIQPLVENSIKFSTCKEPPWNISVLGKVVDNYWHISIEDNGPGFDPQKLESINEQIGEIEKTGLLPGLEIEGMGLLNIYIRLKLIYKTDFIFKIVQNQSGGATIIVGGSIKNEQ